MNSKKWTWFAIAYQLLFSYVIALMVYQFGKVFILGEAFGVGTVVAVIIFALMVYLLCRKSTTKKGEVKRAVEVK